MFSLCKKLKKITFAVNGSLETEETVQLNKGKVSLTLLQNLPLKLYGEHSYSYQSIHKGYINCIVI